MRVLVCGGRDFSDRQYAFSSLAYYSDTWGPFSALIHGGARGADALAGEFALARGIPCEVYPANWDRDGKAAGPIRNRRMLVEGKPDLVIAFPGGRGTADMVRQSERAGVKVITVNL